MFLIRRLPFLAEVFINGSFILFYSFLKTRQPFLDVDEVTLQSIFGIATWLVPLVLFFVLITNFLEQVSFEDFIRGHVFSLIVFIPILITWGDIEFVFWLSSVHLFSTIVSFYDSNRVKAEPATYGMVNKLGFLSHMNISAAQLVLITWAGLTVLGTLLLLLPIATSHGGQLSFIDALFVSTSAVSTTGLNTISTPDDLSIFGQSIILILFQIGGVGFMALSSSLILLTGRTLAMKERVVLLDILDVSEMSELFELVFDIMKFTFVIEFVGAILLTVGFYQEGLEIGESLWNGFFHSISAFCTAGFALFNNSMEDYSTNPLISTVITIEGLLGGLGFIVMKELTMVIKKEKKLAKLSIHSKVILVAQISIVLFGTSIVFFGEFLSFLADYSLFDKLQISLFQFVAALSTHGFNSVPMASLQSYTIYFLTLIMFIGGSPGSTAGGIKLTTLAILIQSVRTTLHGKTDVEFFERSIATGTVVKAIAITMISLLIVCTFIFIMVILEPAHSFLSITFEVLSAFGTVGLSLGITGSLSWLGKLAIIIVMFIGRIGPLTMVLAVGEKKERHGAIKYPTGRIMIG